ncbi:MAG: hypothetical protein WC663_04880 [Patescibacteria group bacterium]|jgi:hypothetical protein
MPENFQESLEKIKDVETPEKKSEEPGFEIVDNEQSREVVKLANDLAGKIEGDEKIIGEDILNLREALGRIKYNFYGEQMTTEEINRISDLKADIKIWKAIEDDNQDALLRSYKEMTYIPPDIAAHFVDLPMDLHLDKVTFLSDESAKHLAKVRGILFLSDIKKLSDKAALYLGEHVGDPEQDSDSLHLDNLEEISEQGLRNLAKHPGWVLLPLGGLYEKFSKYREEFKSKQN